MNSFSTIIMILLLAVLLALAILMTVRMRSDARAQRQAMDQLQRQMWDELDRSRLDTVDLVQSSVRNMGEMLARSQQDAARDQNQRLYQLNQEMHAALSEVSRSLGEMQSLSAGVGDLKKVLSNVKTRGILGEVQLGAILEDILAPEQYEENVAVTGTSQRVEYAVRFPAEDGEVVYLPIDSKFPADAYMNLMDAYETADPEEIRACREILRRAVLRSAGDIRDKYVRPPATTDFGIMFLPFEGLYAEVLRLNLISQLQNQYKVCIAGPTTMAAMLNSFQMGFRSLALSQRSGQVWKLLTGVSTEFEKFEETIDKSRKHLQMAEKDLDELIGPRTRQIRKALQEVSRLERDMR